MLILTGKNMKIKFKLKNTEIFKYIYYGLLFINLIILFFLYNFTKDNVYVPISIEKTPLNTQIDYLSGRINTFKFDAISETISSKKNIINNEKTIKNIFQ